MEAKLDEQDRMLSVFRLAELMGERGDSRSLEARQMHVHRALQAGEFPGAWKVNPDRETSPWLIPLEEAEEWLNVQ